MGETGENQSGVKLPFKIKNPDGTYVKAYTPKGVEVDQVRHLTSEDVRRLKGMGYQVEVIEPKHFNTFIELSQTTHDKE